MYNMCIIYRSKEGHNLTSYNTMDMTFASFPCYILVFPSGSPVYHPQPEGQTACGIFKCCNGCVTRLLLGKSVNKTQVPAQDKLYLVVWESAGPQLKSEQSLG